MTKTFRNCLNGFCALLFLGTITSSCEKTFDERAVQQQDFTNSAIVQVVNATMNSARNYVYVDGKKVTGSLMATGSIFPTTGHGFVVNPGLHAFLVRDTLSTTTQLPLSFAQTLEPGKHYTVFTYDTITSPQQKTVLDDIVVPTDSTSRIRVANFGYSPNAIPAIDVFSFLLNKNIFTNVATTDVTPFIPYPSFTTDTLYFRDAGSSTTFLKVTLSGGLTTKRSYTLLLRGSYRLQARTLTLYATR